MSLRQGKITKTVWRRSVEKPLHKSKRVGAPGIAYEENCSIIALPQNTVLCAERTVWGNSSQNAAWAVLGAAGEVAVEGAVPQGAFLQCLFPEGTEEETLRELTEAAGRICAELKLPVTGIQADVSCAVNRNVVSAVVQGTVSSKEPILAGGAHSGQEIVLCGYVGLEGMLRILEETEQELSHRFVPSFLAQAGRLESELVLPQTVLDVCAQRKNAGITAIRQIGSGGILAALWDMAEQSDVGLEVSLPGMTLKQETVEICEFFQINPYLLTSVGSFIIVADHAEPVIEVLEKAGARAGRLGVIKGQNARMITSGEEIRYLDRPAEDELVRWQTERFRR